jgi:glycine betaine/proline transport system substrate-binding protein
MLGRKSTKKYAIVGALLTILALAAMACSSSPAVPAVDEAQLSQIVSNAVAKSQQQITAAEIQTMIDAAASESVTAADIKAAVGAATSDAVTAADIKAAVGAATSDAVTAADVQSAIDQAVKEAQASTASKSLTAADIKSAVDAAVLQFASNSLTADEIQAILDEALAAGQPTKSTIVFSDLNWTSAQVQNRIAQYIVEKGYGYPTDTIFGGTLPNFQGLQQGDIDVALEIWLPNQSIGWEKAVELGEVVSVGTSLVGDWQSTFVIPQYLADEYPDLKTPQDLAKPEFQELFSADDSRGKARYIACVPSWSCNGVNLAQIDTYGLTDFLDVISPGSQDLMFAELNSAYDKKEPWLGYMWGTGDPALKLDLVRLEEPEYTKECWDTDKGCAFAESLVLVAVNQSLLPRAPDVIAMLQNWEFTITIYKGIFQWMDANPGSEPSEAAIWFLNNNNVWEDWVTTDAAAAVKAALANES